MSDIARALDELNRSKDGDPDLVARARAEHGALLDVVRAARRLRVAQDTPPDWGPAWFALRHCLSLLGDVEPP